MSLLGHTVDPTQIKARSDSARGYVDSDIPLLQALGIIIKENGIWKMNPRGAIKSKAEIAELLNWVASGKQKPVPAPVIKILCKKRAQVFDSIKSGVTSNGLRKVNNDLIAEIDGLLREEGKSCGSDTGSVITTTVPEKASAAKPGSCTTTVNCDTSAIVSLITKIQASIDTLNKKPDAANNPNVRVLTELIDRLIASVGVAIQNNNGTADTTLFASLHSIKKAIAELPDKIQFNLPPLPSENDDHRLIYDKLKEIMEHLINAPDVNTYTIVQQIKQTLDNLSATLAGSLSVIDASLAKIAESVGTDLAAKVEQIRAAILDGENADSIRELIAELRNYVGRRGANADVGTRLNEIMRTLQRIDTRGEGDKYDLDQQYAMLKELVKDIPALHTLVKSLPSADDLGTSHAAVMEQLETLRRSVERMGSRIPSDEVRQIREIVDSLQSRISHTLPSQIEDIQEVLANVGGVLQEMMQKMNTAPAAAAFDKVVTDVVEQIRPMVAGLDGLTGEIQGLRGNVGTLRNAQAATSEKLVTQTGQISALRDEISALRTEFRTAATNPKFDKLLQDRVSDLAESIEQLRRLITATLSDQDTFKPVLDAIKMQSNAIQRQINFLREKGDRNAFLRRYEEQAEALRKLQGELAAKISELDSSVRSRKALENEIAALRSELERVRNTNLAAARGRISELEAASAEQRRKEGELNAQISKLEADLAKHAGFETVLEEADAALARLRTEYSELERRRVALETRATSLEGQIATEKSERDAERIALNAELEKLRAAALKAAAEADAAKKAGTETAAAHAAELARLKTRIKELEARVSATTDYERVLDDLEQVKKQLAQCEAGRKELEARMASNLNAAERKAKADLEAAMKKCAAEAASRAAQYKSDLEAMQEEFNAARAQLDSEHKGEMEALRKECADIKATADAETAKQVAAAKAEAEDRIRIALEEKAAAEERARRCAEELLELQGKCAGSAAKIAEQEAQIQKLTSECDELKKKPVGPVVGKIVKPAAGVNIPKPELLSQKDLDVKLAHGMTKLYGGKPPTGLTTDLIEIASIMRSPSPSEQQDRLFFLLSSFMSIPLFAPAGTSVDPVSKSVTRWSKEAPFNSKMTQTIANELLKFVANKSNALEKNAWALRGYTRGRRNKFGRRTRKLRK